MREISLKEWLSMHDHTPNFDQLVADQCRCTRDAIHKALQNKERKVWLHIGHNNEVIYPFEYQNRKGVFGFKGVKS